MQETLAIVGRRWTADVLVVCGRGEPKRFGDIRRLIDGISDRLLSQRLRELDSLQLIVREVVPSTPVQILYQLTPGGKELLAALEPLIGWGTRYL
jgi:DNA-binding HxlR family transcriptional regulator